MGKRRLVPIRFGRPTTEGKAFSQGNVTREVQRPYTPSPLAELQVATDAAVDEQPSSYGFVE